MKAEQIREALELDDNEATPRKQATDFQVSFTVTLDLSVFEDESVDDYYDLATAAQYALAQALKALMASDLPAGVTIACDTEDIERDDDSYDPEAS